MQSYEELTLAANMLRSEWLEHRIKWNVNETAQNKDLNFQPIGGINNFSKLNGTLNIQLRNS